LSHAAVVALIASGIWVGHVTLVEKRTLLSELTYTPLPAAKGGGGGGDRSASHRGPCREAEASTRCNPHRAAGSQASPVQAARGSVFAECSDSIERHRKPRRHWRRRRNWN